MSDAPVVDLATAVDLEALVELAALFRDHLEETRPSAEEFRVGIGALLADPWTDLLLARGPADEALGYAQIRYRLSAWAPGMITAELEDLFVRAPARGAGAGRALVEAAVGRARRRGSRDLGLTTNERNSGALALYESAGFTAARRRWGGARALWLERHFEGAEPEVALRRARPADLTFVLAHEKSAENTPFIGSWTREEHLAAIDNPAREHLIIESAHVRLGYLIAYDLRHSGLGVYLKRIVTIEKARGLGRAAVAAFCEHAFRDLAAPFVWLSVYADNARAQRAYRAAGFAEYAPAAAVRAELRAATSFSAASVLMRRQR